MALCNTKYSAEQSIATGLGLDGRGRVTLLGHNLYVRHCQKPDITDDDGHTIIALTDKGRGQTLWYEIIAVGPLVGTSCTRKGPGGLPQFKAWHFPAKVGDLVLLPAVGINKPFQHAPFGWDEEMIVDEYECIVLYPQDAELQEAHHG